MHCKALLATLVIMALVVCDSDAWRRRRFRVRIRVRRLARAVQQGLTAAAASKIVAVGAAAMGKRDADAICVDEATPGLQEACQGLDQEDLFSGISREDLEAGFAAADADADDVLVGDELQAYVDTIQTFAACSAVVQGAQ